MSTWRNSLYYLVELCIKLLVVLLIFSGLRLLFYTIHRALLPIPNISEGLRIFFHALRFDLSAITYTNLLLILSFLLPLPQRAKPWYRRAQRYIFTLFNGIAILFEIVDIAYFPFALRRSNVGDIALAANT
ncbi:MAG TPA: hypothetical protein ENJ45_03075, partial [Phaeodactylibacter sp.]|nr:hypothetical protein [Phaeodactylibacter sp.]